MAIVVYYLFVRKDGTDFYCELTISKHNEDGYKYLVLQLENIDHETAVSV